MITRISKILSNVKINEDTFKMRLEGSFDALPGQFVNVKVNDKSLLLRRPISVYESTDEYLEIIYKVVGEGTKILSTMVEGDSLDILGPVGNPFPLAHKKNVLIVGGGIGVPPLQYLAKKLCKDNNITFVLGFRNKEQIILTNELEKYGNVIVATDDGSVGFNGNVLDCIKFNKIDFDVIYSCGPSRMLEALDKEYQGKKEGYISFEERMACGVGICYGCACKPKKLENGMLRVCKEGPVFELGVISYE